MRLEVAEGVDRLIDHYGLHGEGDSGPPSVDLDPLEGMFRIIREDTSDWGVDGLIVLPPNGVISEQNYARVVLNSQLNWYDERLVYAHEIGHGIIGHEGSVRLDAVDDWFGKRAEVEAWEVAARLLVPWHAVMEYQDVQNISAACLVPEWLVKLAG